MEEINLEISPEVRQKRPNRGTNPSMQARRIKGKRGRRVFFRNKNRKVRETLKGLV